MPNKRLPGWIGSLFSPAENPRPKEPEPSDAAALLSQLRKSRWELAQLRAGVDADNPISRQLAEEEESLLEAEHGLLVSMHEERAHAPA
ncbi:MAG: hypothetical protein JOZ87_24780 [Chloroflexi bacterium]|nr:hypothetical protein [Chloroflexota bacterium]